MSSAAWHVSFNPLAFACGTIICRACSIIGGRKRDILQCQFAGLNLGEIQNVIEDVQQPSAALRSVVTYSLRLRRHLCIHCKLCHSQNAMHRRADLMTHVGQEPAFWQDWLLLPLSWQLPTRGRAHSQAQGPITVSNMLCAFPGLAATEMSGRRKPSKQMHCCVCRQTLSFWQFHICLLW